MQTAQPVQPFQDYLSSMNGWQQGLGANGQMPSTLGTSVNTSLGLSPAGGTVASVGAGSPSQTGIFGKLFGSTDDNGNQTPGVAGQVLGAAGGIANAFMAYQGLKMAKSQLKEDKRQFNLNWDANKTLTNSRLEDRQRARVASNPGAYQSVSAYMNKNGIG